MATTVPNPGLIGFLFSSERESLPPDPCDDICAMAIKLRRRIIEAFMRMEICPDRAIEIDGERWDPERVYRALQELYNWTFDICRKEEDSAVAVFHSNSSCPGEVCA